MRCNPFRVVTIIACFPGLAAKKAANPGLCDATPSALRAIAQLNKGSGRGDGWSSDPRFAV
jgi:hypothetical protein